MEAHICCYHAMLARRLGCRDGIFEGGQSRVTSCGWVLSVEIEIYDIVLYQISLSCRVLHLII